MAISAEHGHNIGELLDEVWAVLPFRDEAPQEAVEEGAEEAAEDEDGTGGSCIARTANTSSTRRASP